MKYCIFKVDNNYYLYDIELQEIDAFGTFQKCFKAYIDFVEFNVLTGWHARKDFSLYIKKF